MSKREFDIARTAAMQVAYSLQETVRDLVNHNLDQRRATEPDPQHAPAPAAASSRRWPRAYDEDCDKKKPLFNPETGFAEFLMRMADWQRGRGELVCTAWLFKPEKSTKLLIQQYGVESPECSILQFDRSQPKTKFSRGGHVVSLGKSPWTGFAARPGTLDEIVAKFKESGWYLQPSIQPRQQLALLDPPCVGPS